MMMMMMIGWLVFYTHSSLSTSQVCICSETCTAAHLALIFMRNGAGKAPTAASSIPAQSSEMCLALSKQEKLKSTLSLSLQILQSDSGVFRVPQNRKRLGWCPVCAALNQRSGMSNVCGGARSLLMVTEKSKYLSREEDKHTKRASGNHRQQPGQL